MRERPCTNAGVKKDLLRKKKNTVLRILPFQRITVKIKESEKRDRDMDLARELRKLWEIRVRVIATMIDTLGKDVAQKLGRGMQELEIKIRMKCILITLWAISFRIRRKILETRVDLKSRRIQ